MSIRAVIVLVALASALGFSPSASTGKHVSNSRVLSMNAAMKKLPGATSPFGFFDPVGFSAKLDATGVARYRECELKHGRVAMLAFIGILAGEAIEGSTPFALSDKILGPAVYHVQEANELTGFGFTFFIIGLISIIEGYGVQQLWKGGKMRIDVINGDLGWDPLGLKPSDAPAFAKLQTQEINNGRLAMIAVAGMVVQELVNGKGILENLGWAGPLPAAFDTGIF